mmetsp:Transcript_75966/g.216769  ORF Transcript_75966/g.216769 Transcript_75966/m.216769 type:complete len:403 (+) Transcript_75966:174-1382(+)
MRSRLEVGASVLLDHLGAAGGGRGGGVAAGDAVLRLVHAVILHRRVDAEHAHAAEGAEDNARKGGHPDDDGEEEADGRGERRSVAAVEDASAVLGAVAVVGGGVVVLGREERGHDHAVEAAEAVDRDGRDNVIDLARGQERVRAKVDECSAEADDERAVRLAGRARGGDGDEAREDAVVGIAELEHVGTIDLALHERADEEGGDGARAGGEGGGDHGLGGDEAVVHDVEGRDAVETVPAHPENECAEGLEDRAVLRGVVRREGEERAAGHRLASLTRLEESRADEGGDAAGHVHDARASEVDDAAAEEERVRVVVDALPGRGPALGVPAPAHDDRVDEAGEADRVGDVGGEGAPLGDGSRHDGGGGGREGPLEEPHAVHVALAPELVLVEPHVRAAHEAART